MRTAQLLLIATALMPTLVHAMPITYEVVAVGDAGNQADTTGSPNPCGAVAYDYKIGKYEFTAGQYVQFLNSVDPDGTNPYGIARMTSSGIALNAFRQITYNANANSGAKYQAVSNMANKPITYITWLDAARLANWMHNGQGSGSTETGAYTLLGKTGGNNVPKNPDAKFWIPTQSEWYKAAYYKGGGINAGYWDYATQSDIAPSVITASIIGDGSAGNSGNYANYTADGSTYAVWNGVSPGTGIYTSIGTNGGPSAYGAFDMSGNVLELNDLDGAGEYQYVGYRGGFWAHSAPDISSSWGFPGGLQTIGSPLTAIGVRFAAAPVAVPEPSTWVMCLGGLACAAWASRRRRAA